MDNTKHDLRKKYSQLMQLAPETVSPDTFKTGSALKSSCARLARFLVGYSIGLALGGGGARGLAHVGVMEVLEKEGFAIDGISGASAGAIFGSAIASGMNAFQLRRFVYENVMFAKPFSDYKLLPVRSFIKGNRGRKILARGIGDLMTYDMKIPYLPVAVNIKTGKLEVIKGAPAWKACMASGAAPGLIEPQLVNGRTYLDGGIVDNVPASPLRDWGIDFIIAVNISVRPEESSYNDRHVLGIIRRAFDIMGYDRVSKYLASSDLNVIPNVDAFTITDWTNESIIEEGHKAMKKKLGELRFALKRMKK